MEWQSVMMSPRNIKIADFKPNYLILSYNPDNESAHMQDYRAMNSDASNAKIFDFLSISDPRIPELCARAGQPPPFQVLQEHLKRYSTFGDTTITTNTLRIRHQKHRFELKVGEHSVRVMCVNKREGKQKAAQAMLKKCFVCISYRFLFNII